MVTLREKISILVILVLAICLRVHSMTRGFFYDELYSIVHYLQAPTLLEAVYKDFTIANHLGYTVLAYLSCHLLGLKEWTLRLPALFFGVAGIFIFWHWTRKHFDSPTALLGALLLALAPAHVIWSSSGRGYSACIFFTILSTALYFSFFEKPSFKASIMLAIINTVAFSFNAYFLCVFFTQLLHLLLISRWVKKETLMSILLSAAVSIIGSIIIYLPIMPVLKSMATDHRAFVTHFPLTLLSEYLSLNLWPLGIICLILIILGFVFSNNRLAHWRLYLTILFLTFIPVWLAKPVYLYPRFFAYLLPFLFLLMASGIVYIINKSSSRLRPFTVTIIIAILSLLFWSWASKPSQLVEDFHYKFRDAMQFAKSAASSQTIFCAFGPEDGFYQVYSDRPVVRFNTFGDFINFYKEHKEIICFSIMGPPMTQEHKKICLFVLTVLNPPQKNFDNVIVFDLKG